MLVSPQPVQAQENKGMPLWQSLLSIALGPVSNIIGGLFNRSGASQAADASLTANRETLEFMREQAAREEAIRQDALRRYDEAYLAQQQYRAPFRNIGLSILRDVYGQEIPESAWQVPAASQTADVSALGGPPPALTTGMSPAAGQLSPVAMSRPIIPRRTPTTQQTIAQMMQRYG